MTNAAKIKRAATTPPRLFDDALLALPIFDDRHRAVSVKLERWVFEKREEVEDLARGGQEVAARALVKLLARDGWLDVATGYQNGQYKPDFRAICLCREAFAWMEDLCDFAFSIQALAAYVLASAGENALHRSALDALRTGEAIGAFALSEAGAGSDLAAVRLQADTEPNGFRLSGEKMWIANAGIADVVVVLARTGGPGALGLSLFVVAGEAMAQVRSVPIAMMAPRAFGTLVFENCVLPKEALLGSLGVGFVFAVDTLEKFRLTVGAAAIGFARRALGEALDYSRSRWVEGQPLVQTQIIRCKLAEMACALNSGALLTAQAAWETDMGSPTASIRSSMAKLTATEASQRIVDHAVQILGAAGCMSGSISERLYRQIRSLRIYEGTSEIQQLIIGNAVAAGRI